MAYELLVEQIKSVPKECLEDIGNYIEFVLYKYNQSVKEDKSNDLSKHFGSVKFHRDAMEIQKEMRDEWN